MDSENTAEKEHFTTRSKEIKKKKKNRHLDLCLIFLNSSKCLSKTDCQDLSLVGELTRLWSSCSL